MSPDKLVVALEELALLVVGRALIDVQQLRWSPSYFILIVV